MEFSWSEKEQQQRASARRLAAQNLATPSLLTGFDRSRWDLLAGCGVFHLDPARPSTHLRTAAMLLEALGSGGADRGLLFSAGAHYFGCTVPIARFGNPHQIAQWLPSLAKGLRIGCVAITEPGAGSNISSMQTVASRQGDLIVLDGIKTFVTNGPVANVALVIASEAPSRGSLGLSAFLVPADSEGLEIIPLRAVGLASAPAGEIRFRKVPIQANWRLGPPGGGLAILLAAMQAERTAILSGFLGAAEYDLSKCYRYLSCRSQSGQTGTLAEHQVIKHRLAEMRCRLESARWLLYRGIWEVEHGTDRIAWPAIVKKSVSEALVHCAQDILGLYAGAGWLNLHNSTDAVQDTLAILSASGTSDIQLNIIASQLTKTLVPLD